MRRATSRVARAAAWVGATVACAQVAAPVARAGGLFVPGYGSQAQPRAGAFVAKADDPSALYYNPAGLAKQKGTSIHLGFNLIDFDQSYKRAGTYGAPEDGEPPAWVGDGYSEVSDDSTPAVGVAGFQGIPLFGIATDLGGATPLVFGIGLIADHGFPEREYGGGYTFEDPNTPAPPGRYDVIEQDVSAAFPSIAAAYSITPALDIGVRVSWGFAGSKGTQYLWGIRNYEEDPGRDGIFKVDVADNFIPAAGAGLLWRPAPTIEIGASYHAPKTINFEGEGTAQLGAGLGIGDMREFIAPEVDTPACAGGGTITALKSCVTLKLPQTATAGARYVLRDAGGGERADVELDVQWEDWSNAADIEVVVDGKSGLTNIRLQPSVIRHGFQDTYSVRLGGAYGFDVGDNRIIARAGAAYDTAAAPLSWTRLDIDGMARTTLGGGLAFDTGKVRIEAGGGVVLEASRTVPECDPDLDNLGCETPGDETPQAGRDAPDPIQPLSGQNNQVESPFNGGIYEQGYVLFSLGATYRF